MAVFWEFIGGNGLYSRLGFNNMIFKKENLLKNLSALL